MNETSVGIAEEDHRSDKYTDDGLAGIDPLPKSLDKNVTLCQSPSWPLVLSITWWDWCWIS